MKPQTILVVEDNPVTLKMVRLTLEREGYDVIEAADGRTAIEAMSKHALDLVLQDLVLSDMDGLDLVKALRRLPSCAGIPILACSGFLSRMEQARTLQIGFTDFLFKPVEPSRLLEVVHAYLQPRVDEAKRGNGRVVLIAEDDPILLKLERLCLEQTGFQVLTALDGHDALEKVRRAPPDAIVADVLMPELDGFRLCQAIRQDARLVSIPVVLFSSAYDEDNDVRLARMVGADALVLRTPDFQNVINCLLAGFKSSDVKPALPTQLVTEEYTNRIVRQLERHVALNGNLAARLAVREAEISIFTGFAETLRGTSTVDRVLREVLYRCLDAGGISQGAAYLCDPEGRLSLAAYAGFSESTEGQLEDFFGHAEALTEVLAAGEPTLLEHSEAKPDERVHRAAAPSILLTPIVSGGERLGVLAMISGTRDLTAEWLDFGKGLGYQLGHAIALSRVFSRLEAAEQRYRRIFESSVVGIYRSTLDGRFEVANPALAQTLGYASPEELISQLGDIRQQFYLDPGRRTEFLRLLHERGVVSHFQSQVRRKDGVAIWVSETARAVRDEGGRVAYVEGIVEDITPRKQMEEALRQSEKLAAMGSLLAGVAHELNNPLSILLGQASLMQLETSGPLAERVEKVAQAAERCARIVKSFLSLARQRPTERRAASLNQAVKDALELLAYPLRVGDVKVRLDLERDLPALWADSNQLHQVLINLVTNAHQAMQVGGTARELTLTTKYQPATNRVVLHVADTGPGIAAEVRSRVFDPFFTTKLPGQGTGLGLSLCQSVVEEHGGTIRVESEPGRGAVFTVELPVGTRPFEQAEARGDEPSAATGKAVLVVDDEAVITELLDDMLSIDGHKVDKAYNGAQALEKIRRGAYDLIVSDVRMPEIGGPRLYREVTGRYPALRGRFVFLTGDVLNPEIREFLDECGTLCLHKPFTLDDVRRVVNEALHS